MQRLGRHRNVDRWPQFGTDGQGLMHRVLDECLDAVFVYLLRPVVGREHFLFDEMIEAWPHLRVPRRAVVEQLSTM